MKFRYEFEYNDDNDDERCILRATTVAIGYCIDKQMKCKGKLDDRPEWCPLVEVKDLEKVRIGQWFNPSELTYKGYKAKILSEGNNLHGTVTNIDDVITFRAKDFDQAQTEFETSVDYYLEFCEKHGRKPEQPWE
jgi:hypothetical protein